MRGQTGGNRIIASGSVVAVPGEEAILEGDDGFSLTIRWCDDGIQPGGNRRSMSLELPLDQEPDRIFMGFSLYDDYGSTTVRFVVDWVSETLRLITITAYDGPPED